MTRVARRIHAMVWFGVILSGNLKVPSEEMA